MSTDAARPRLRAPVPARSPGAGAPPRPAARAEALRAGMRLEQGTVAWMTLEALVAIAAGVAAHSLLLVAFGLDSVIELISGAAMLGRLGAEAGGRAPERVDRAERRATWVVAASLAGLCVYIAATAAWGLAGGRRPEASVPGVLLAAAALVVMPLLAAAKRRVAAAIDSAALRGDAACSVTCAAMAAAMLGGLGLNLLWHWWRAEYLAALAFLWWLVPETLGAARAALGQRAGCGCGAE